MSKLVGLLMNSRTQSHYFHRGTTSYARHQALQKYYEKIVDLIDTYAEAYGKKLSPIRMNKQYLTDADKAPAYFKRLLARVKATKVPKDLVSIRDDIVILIKKTLYLLRLK